MSAEKSLSGDQASTSVQENDKDGWILELETALLSDCDMEVIRKMSSQYSIPNNLRYEFWQACLGIKGRVKILEDIFDLPEQNQIRKDCQALVDKLTDNSSSEKLSIMSDLESILTNFSRLNHCPYESDNGWLDLLEVLIHLNVRREELFKVFETVELRYITKYYNTNRNIDPEQSKLVYMQPFHLLRLLLLYHDPDLCNYFDTVKLTPENFSSTWFRSLFCSSCNPIVALSLLDAYFACANPFMVFFLSLVMLINLKDDLKMKTNKKEIVSMLSAIPASITEADIKDMFFIAEQHFFNKTPVSVKEFQQLLFQVYPQNEIQSDLHGIKNLSNLLCLQISVQELLNSCQAKSDFRYFVVDCRPPDQYNNGHLLTAFHLDCSLLLNDPSVFGTAVQALLASQKQAIEANSMAGGEHLCFMGSGNDDEDCFIHMVLSWFLQKHHKYVSLLHGGYDSLHRYIVEKQYDGIGTPFQLLVDHNPKQCLSCIRRPHRSSANPSDSSTLSKEVDQLTSVFFQKFSNVVKPKFSEMKDKLVEYVVNPNQKPVIKHVSADNLGKRYKGNKFSLDDSSTDFDEETDNQSVENAPEIDIEGWKKRSDLIGCFECSKINSDGTEVPGFLGLTRTHLYMIKRGKKEGYGEILVKRPLEMILQITSKRKCPEIITFKYGHSGGIDSAENPEQPLKSSSLFAKDSFILVEPFEVIRMIKQQVVTLLDQNNSLELDNHQP